MKVSNLIPQHLQIKIRQLSKLKKTKQSFIKWHKPQQKWLKVPQVVPAHHSNISSIKASTLNILYDQMEKQNRRGSMEHVINSQKRYAYILDKIGSMMHDVITLQQVTHLFCEMLLQCQWAKENYWISNTIDQKRSFGNIILTKVQPIALELIKVKRLPRRVPTAFFSFGSSIVSLSSVHLIALQSNVHIRDEQFAHLKQQLDSFNSVVDHFVLQGDMNFHQEIETQIPLKNGFKDCWLEYYKNNLKDFPGFTFDSQKNHMINQYYWGFEKRRMRLDRILILGNIEVKNMKIIFNDAIDKQGNNPLEKVDSYFKVKGGLLYIADYFGWNLRPEQKKYLFASDHFGLEALLIFN